MLDSEYSVIKSDVIKSFDCTTIPLFANTGGSVKPVQMRWLAQTLPWRPFAKSLLQI